MFSFRKSILFWVWLPYLKLEIIHVYEWLPITRMKSWITEDLSVQLYGDSDIMLQVPIVYLLNRIYFSTNITQAFCVSRLRNFHALPVQWPKWYDRNAETVYFQNLFKGCFSFWNGWRGKTEVFSKTFFWSCTSLKWVFTNLSSTNLFLRILNTAFPREMDRFSVSIKKFQNLS